MIKHICGLAVIPESPSTYRIDHSTRRGDILVKSWIVFTGVTWTLKWETHRGEIQFCSLAFASKEAVVNYLFTISNEATA